MSIIKHMVRTQVYLSENLQKNIKLVARKEKKSAAQVIREALEKGLAKKAPKRSVGEALLELAAIGKRYNIKGPTDLSTNHDKYLYEE